MFEDFFPHGRMVTAELKDGHITYLSTGLKEADRKAPDRVIYEIGSTTKIFSGIMLAQSVVEGLVTLDSTLAELMPEQPFRDLTVGQVTIGELATHTSGLPTFAGNFRAGSNPADPFAHYDRNLLLEWVSGVDRTHESPAATEYSNFGVSLLCEVLTRIHQRTWEDLIREKVTEPLGMEDTVVDLSAEQHQRFAPGYLGGVSVEPMHWSAMVGAGGLKSTASDLIKLGKAIISPEDTPLAEAIKLMLTPRTDQRHPSLLIGRYKSLSGDLAYGHDGGTTGHRCVFEALPQEEGVNIVLANDFLMDGRILLQKRAGEETRYDKPESAGGFGPLEDYAGTYRITSDTPDHIQNGEFRVEISNGRLTMELIGSCFLHPAYRLYQSEEKDHFFIRDIAATCEFVRYGTSVTSLIYRDHFQYDENWAAMRHT